MKNSANLKVMLLSNQHRRVQIELRVAHQARI